MLYNIFLNILLVRTIIFCTRSTTHVYYTTYNTTRVPLKTRLSGPEAGRCVLSTHSLPAISQIIQCSSRNASTAFFTLPCSSNRCLACSYSKPNSSTIIRVPRSTNLAFDNCMFTILLP